MASQPSFTPQRMNTDTTYIGGLFPSRLALPALPLLIPPWQPPTAGLWLYFSPDLQGPSKPHPKPPPSTNDPSCCGTVTHTDGGRSTDLSHIDKRVKVSA